MVVSQRRLLRGFQLTFVPQWQLRTRTGSAFDKRILDSHFMLALNSRRRPRRGSESRLAKAISDFRGIVLILKPFTEPLNGEKRIEPTYRRSRT